MIKLERYAGEKAQAYKVTMGWVNVWFSYETPIAFQTPEGLVVSENPAGTTTGRHINAVPGAKTAKRIPHTDFLKQLEELTA